MRKGMKYMTAVSYEIEKIIQAPPRKMDKSEAMEVLRSCGILSKNNTVKGAYKGILTEDASRKHEGA